VRRWSPVLVAALAALTWFVAATVLIPVRVTFGAGSLRCGTVLHPDTASEIGDVCPEVTDDRLREAWPTSALFAGFTALSFVGLGSLRRWGRLARLAGAAAVSLGWLFATALLLYGLTGAHSAPRS
jgi:hypothetical protein